MIREFRRGLALLAVATLVLLPSFATAQTADPLEIPVVLPLSGFASFIGRAQADTLGIIERLTNEHGGIRGRPVKFVIADSQTNPAVAVQLVNALLAKHTPVLLGPGFTSECAAVAPLVGRSAVDYCISPAISPPPGSYVYSAGMAGSDYPVLLLRYFKTKHYARVALIASTDAAGQFFETFFNQTLSRPEFRGFDVVAREHFAVTDLSANAQLARIKAARPDVVIEWTAGTAFATLLRGTQEVGLDLPIAGGTGNTTYEQMAQYKAFLPKVLVFPTTSAATPGGVGPGPIRDAQQRYFAAFRRAGIRPDFLNSQIWDPAMIVLDALRAVGPNAQASQVQAELQQMHGWVGITGVYDFRDGSQRGLTTSAGIVARWDASRNDFVAVTGLGGMPRAKR